MPVLEAGFPYGVSPILERSLLEDAAVPWISPWCPG